MSARLLILLVAICSAVLAAENGDSCATPNGEMATCVPIRQCKVITDAISTRNETAIDFAKQSQCGWIGSDPMVCCGTSGYFTFTDLFGLFTRTPEATTSTPTTSSTTPRSEKQNVILQNFETKDLPDRTVCGLDKEEDRVIGGNITDIGEFPWMAALEYKSKFTGLVVGIRCGGSVINNRFVLTAAHCLLHRELELISVWLGEWQISKDPDCTTLIAQTECADAVLKVKVREQIPHPYYSKRSGNNDIGLLWLEQDITFTDYIRPICMPPANLPPPAIRTPMTVAGWGLTENSSTSDIKLKVQVPLLSNEACIKKLNGRAITPNQLCAGGEEGKDSCQGDSGGPLMRSYEDRGTQQIQWYQEGVVSWGEGCGIPGYPAIYTRVSRYISWIINNISED